MTSPCNRTTNPPNPQLELNQIAQELVLYSESARRHDVGWQRCVQEFNDSNGTDFGYPNPYEPGTPEHEGYRDAVAAYNDDYTDDLGD